MLFATALRVGHAEAQTFAVFLAQVQLAGVSVDWPAFYADSGARAVELPTYAFQRQRYWLSPATGTADPATAGLGRVDHPILAGAVRVGDGDSWLFTGRLCTDTQPWIRDHVLLGMVVVAGAALVELALAAGRHAGSPVVEELVLAAPLILREGVAVQVQVTVGEPDEDGRREVAIYTRPESGDEDGDRAATCHARGTLVARAVS